MPRSAPAITDALPRERKSHAFTFLADAAKTTAVVNDAAIWKSLNAPRRLTLIAGPCVIEDEGLCLKVASTLKKTCDLLGIFYVFKASFDKANRTSAKSFRGPGLEAGLKVLA